MWLSLVEQATYLPKPAVFFSSYSAIASSEDLFRKWDQIGWKNRKLGTLIGVNRLCLRKDKPRAIFLRKSGLLCCPVTWVAIVQLHVCACACMHVLYVLVCACVFVVCVFACAFVLYTVGVCVYVCVFVGLVFCQMGMFSDHSGCLSHLQLMMEHIELFVITVAWGYRSPTVYWSTVCRRSSTCQNPISPRTGYSPYKPHHFPLHHLSRP